MDTVIRSHSANESLLARQARRESNARSYPRRLPLAIHRAEGIYVTDMDGQQYIDCLAGAGTLALGHNHTVVREAISKAMDSYTPLHTLDLTTPIKESFIDEVYASLPGSFAEKAKIQFCGPTGGDAIEAALKLVKTATGNRSILSFQGGYHGSTHGTLSISGTTAPKGKIHALVPDAHFLPYPYAYRCPFNIGAEGHRVSNAYIENLLDDPESGIVAPAGIIVEVVQGEGGSIPAPIEWLQQLRRLTKERHIPLIIDEVQTGIGRTGKMFAFEHAGIEPDVLVLSKAIGGSLPLSVVLYDQRLDLWEPGAHIGTFRGNQLAMAAGKATLQFIKEHQIPDHAAELGAYFMKQLTFIQKQVSSIGEVRGRGLMIGIEIVDPTKQPNGVGSYPAYPELAKTIQQECFKRGLILEVGGRFSTVIRLLPPLVITKEQVDEVLNRLHEAITSAEHQAGIPNRR
ncbi:aspartate aminotransferase family protein [Bacillus thermotolerans]|uniref:aspartate aminotransferase family protein n=1 Tax=Bacillus thermotolerans TaxID=1221996 RepID=UPI00057D589F|nr:aspartate aminotransferase family protein [Bacillus thermotolerans]KKB38629.1 Siderophore biosynthesis diaminobutyrate--2-oxoglutarate aminotransferase [Bacillus thermotolerans]